MHDLVIRSGLVVDGTGAPARVADVAVDGDRIVEVVEPGAAGPARRTVDADGLLVTPGFVDVHTHFDGQATWDPWLTPSSWHGVTTVVGGNCGVGFAPVHHGHEDWLVQLMEGVEDIPGSALSEGISWGWESFGEFLDVVGSTPHVIDHGYQLAHGPLRGYVMGERGAANESATAEDLLAMQRLAEEALAAGALGISTSRTSLHKAADGRYVPGTFAEADELFALADALRAQLDRTGRRSVFQMALEHVDVPDQFGWMRAFAERSGATVSFNFSQTRQAPELWHEVLALLEQSRALGASFVQSMLLAMAEARVSVMVAAVACIGASFSEVGAVVIVGGNIDLQTQTIAGAILTTVAQGRYSEAIALGVILLGVVLVLTAFATLVQHGRRTHARAARRIAA